VAGSGGYAVVGHQSRACPKHPQHPRPGRGSRAAAPARRDRTEAASDGAGPARNATATVSRAVRSVRERDSVPAAEPRRRREHRGSVGGAIRRQPRTRGPALPRIPYRGRRCASPAPGPAGLWFEPSEIRIASSDCARHRFRRAQRRRAVQPAHCRWPCDAERSPGHWSLERRPGPPTRAPKARRVPGRRRGRGARAAHRPAQSSGGAPQSNRRALRRLPRLSLLLRTRRQPHREGPDPCGAERYFFFRFSSA
jgi:hypothetical protein